LLPWGIRNPFLFASVSTLWWGHVGAKHL
jgi:hypothetical protein